MRGFALVQGHVGSPVRAHWEKRHALAKPCRRESKVSCCCMTLHHLQNTAEDALNHRLLGSMHLGRQATLCVPYLSFRLARNPTVRLEADSWQLGGKEGHWLAVCLFCVLRRVGCGAAHSTLLQLLLRLSSTDSGLDVCAKTLFASMFKLFAGLAVANGLVREGTVPVGGLRDAVGLAVL